MMTSVTKIVFHNTTPCCKTKTKTTMYKTKTTACKTKTDFLVLDRSCPKTDGHSAFWL